MKRARSTHGGPSGPSGKSGKSGPSGKSGMSGPSGRRARISCVFCGATDRPSNHTCAEKRKSLALSEGGDPGGCSLDAALVEMEAGAGEWEGSDGGGGGGEDDSGGGGTGACAGAGSGTPRLPSAMGPADSDHEQQDWTTEEEGSDSADGEAAEGPVEQDRQQRRRTTWRYPSLGRQGNRAPCTAPPLATPSPWWWR